MLELLDSCMLGPSKEHVAMILLVVEKITKYLFLNGSFGVIEPFKSLHINTPILSIG